MSRSNLLLQESFTIETLDSIPVVIQKLILHVKDFAVVISSQKDPFFTSKVSKPGFKLSRIHNHRYFSPFIIGTFKNGENGTLIHVQIGLRSFRYYTFLITSCVAPLVFALSFIVSTIDDGGVTLSSLSFLTFVVMGTISTAQELKLFWSEVEIVKTQLIDVFVESVMKS